MQIINFLNFFLINCIVYSKKKINLYNETLSFYEHNYLKFLQFSIRHDHNQHSEYY